MNLEEKGAYITLLCFQAAKGPLSEADILKKIPTPIWQAICCKFVCKDGLYQNERLAKEIIKRKLYCENRRSNLHMKKHMDKHMKGSMTSHMENENINSNNKGVVKGGRFEEFWAAYPRQVGMQMALMTYMATIKTDKDFEDLMLALKNYKASKDVKGGFIMNGDKWIEDWRGWLGQKPKSSLLAKYEVKS